MPPSVHNANVVQDSKPWADDRAPNAIFACFVSFWHQGIMFCVFAVDSLGVITNVYHIHYAWLATEAPGINGFVLDLGVPILPCRIVGVHVIFTPLNGILFAKWASFAPSEGNYYHIGPSVLPVAAHHGALRVKIHMEARSPASSQ